MGALGTEKLAAAEALVKGRKPALPWATAWRVAWRELRASKGKFAFVLLSVAIGVAALTGVRGFSEAQPDGSGSAPVASGRAPSWPSSWE